MAVVYRAALAAVQMRKTTGKSSGGAEITSANRAGVRARVRACVSVCVCVCWPVIAVSCPIG